MQTDNSLDNLQTLAKEKLGGDGWYILQSYTGNTFEKWTPSTEIKLGDEYAGTIFGPNAELRWTRDNGAVSLVVIEDFPSDTHLLVTRDYLAWGEWENNRFWQPEIDKVIKYPLDGPFKEHARVAFTVHEFYKRKPNTLPSEVNALTDKLNEPLFEAYRLVDIHIATEKVK